MRIRFSRQRGPCTVQHNWRVSQLKRLGVPGPLAEIYADRIDWHQMARLVRCGYPPRLALRIVG